MDVFLVLSDASVPNGEELFFNLDMFVMEVFLERPVDTPEDAGSRWLNNCFLWVLDAASCFGLAPRGLVAFLAML